MERHHYGRKIYEITVHWAGYIRKLKKVPINFGGIISWKTVGDFEAHTGKILTLILGENGKLYGETNCTGECQRWVFYWQCETWVLLTE
jgi:hypothetical protein